jgi:RNA polymerase sigma-70 factor (ECF subfamily)
VASDDPIRELVREAQGGSVRAFELLVSAHLPQLRRFARGFARDEADADDLAQEALVKVYKSLRSFKFQAAFSTWLFALARNVFLDSTRSRAGRERSKEDSLGEEARELPAASSDAPDEVLHRAQERERLWRCLREVPTEFRSALILFDLEGHSYEEVAAIEAVPIGTVKSRLSRGRGLLRELLAEEEHTPSHPGAARPGTPGEEISSHGRRSDK